MRFTLALFLKATRLRNAIGYASHYGNVIETHEHANGLKAHGCLKTAWLFPNGEHYWLRFLIREHVS